MNINKVLDYHHHNHHNHANSGTSSSSSNIHHHIGSTSNTIIPTSNSAINQLSASSHLIEGNNANNSQIASTSASASTIIAPFNTPSSITLTNNTLARIFSILLKLISELLSVHVNSNNHKNQTEKLTRKLNKKLDAPWRWLVTIMDSTESQLRFGASLSATQTNELSTSATKFLRHLEEKALLTNYFNNNNSSVGANSCGSTSGSGSSVAGAGYYGAGGPFISSRFGSGIDARRKLTIMQHQHQQFANMHMSRGI